MVASETVVSAVASTKPLDEELVVLPLLEDVDVPPLDELEGRPDELLPLVLLPMEAS
jgi:hypothetical protein